MGIVGQCGVLERRDRAGNLEPVMAVTSATDDAAIIGIGLEQRLDRIPAGFRDMQKHEAMCAGNHAGHWAEPWRLASIDVRSAR